MKGMTKGIGPNGLGSAAKMMKKAPMKVMDEKSMAKMGHMDKSAAKIMGRNLADAADKKRAKAEKAEVKGKLKKAERLRGKASKLDKKYISKVTKVFKKAFDEASK